MIISGVGSPTDESAERRCCLPAERPSVVQPRTDTGESTDAQVATDSSRCRRRYIPSKLQREAGIMKNAIRQWHTRAKNVREHLGLDTPGANEIPQRDRRQWVGSTFLSHLPETFTVLQTAKMHPSRQPAKMLEHQGHTHACGTQ